MFLSTRTHNYREKQGGWLMPLAAFIVIVMALLAVTLGRLVSNTSVASAQELISTQTFYAAEAGAQYGMSRVFYDTASPTSRASGTAACASSNGQVINFNAAGLGGCRTQVNCQSVVDASNTTTFFTISSQANCGSGNVTSQRTVSVSAYLQ
ncbi:hypothetical protein NBRC116494_14440 [Aurantivibrio plasticivorans]